jgi:probable selenium-dependent hydroxylase accessory protein YqeC
LSAFSFKKLFSLSDKGIISIVGAGGKTTLMFSLAKELAKAGYRVLTTTTTKIFMPKKHQSVYTLISEDMDKILEKSKALLKRENHFSAGRKLIKDINKLVGFGPDQIDQLVQSDLFDFIIVEADGSARKSMKACAGHEPVVPRDTACLIWVAGLDVLGKSLNEQVIHRAKIFSQITGVPLEKTITGDSLAAAIEFEMEKIKFSVEDGLKFVLLNKADEKKIELSAQKVAGLILNNNNNIERVIIVSLESTSPVKRWYDKDKERRFNG